MDDVLDDVDDDDNELSSSMLLFSLICFVPPADGFVVANGIIVAVVSSTSSFRRGTIVAAAAAAAAAGDSFCRFSGFFRSSSIEYGFLFRDDVADEVVCGMDVDSRIGLPVVVEADGDDLPESQSLNGSLALFVVRSMELSDFVMPE